MYVGLKQPRGDGERYVTPARAAAMETKLSSTIIDYHEPFDQGLNHKLSRDSGLDAMNATDN